jgi:hypothetical protein
MNQSESNSASGAEASNHAVARLLTYLRGVDWHRVNYILIPERYSQRDGISQLALWLSAEQAAGTMVRRLGILQRPIRWLALHALSFTRQGRATIAVCLVFAVLGVNVEQTQLYLLFCLTAALLAVSVSFAAFVPPPAVRACVVLPRRVTCGAQLVMRVECTRLSRENMHTGQASVVNADAEGMAIALSMPFTPFALPVIALNEVFQPDTAPGEYVASARMRTRYCGVYSLGTQSIREVMPLGLTGGQRLYVVGGDVRVVPRPQLVVGLADALGVADALRPK